MYGKPIIIYNRSEFPSKIFDFGENVIVNNFKEASIKISSILKNFDSYNTNLDLCRNDLFFSRDKENFYKELENIYKTA